MQYDSSESVIPKTKHDDVVPTAHDEATSSLDNSRATPIMHQGSESSTFTTNVANSPTAPPSFATNSPSSLHQPTGFSSHLASLSHGNLLETSSQYSSGVYSADESTKGLSTSAPRGDTGFTEKQKSRRVLNNLMSRSRSVRKEPPEPLPTPARQSPSSRPRWLEAKTRKPQYDLGPMTAPLQPDRSYQEMMTGSTVRGKSAERHSDQDEERPRAAKHGHSSRAGERSKASEPSKAVERSKVESSKALTSTKALDTSKPLPTPKDQSSFFFNLRNSSSKAAESLGKAGKGVYNKLARGSGSNLNEPFHPPVDYSNPNYAYKILHLPLSEQVRKTRIANTLESARDKTEFWLPAIAYRTIDFLNRKGLDEEGLYRVSGSRVEIVKYQIKFDMERDVDLMNEDDLFNVCTVADLLKKWLTGLPGQLLPQSIQDRISKAHDGETPDEVPQNFKDELSQLPPVQYYLLFALTCHINVLLSHQATTRMDFNALAICFQPCTKINPFCFRLLVEKWPDCWQGCWDEDEWLREEYTAMEQDRVNRDRSASSGDKSRPSTRGAGIAVSTDAAFKPYSPHVHASTPGHSGRQSQSPSGLSSPDRLKSPPGTSQSASHMAQIEEDGGGDHDALVDLGEPDGKVDDQPKDNKQTKHTNGGASTSNAFQVPRKQLHGSPERAQIDPETERELPRIPRS